MQKWWTQLSMHADQNVPTLLKFLASMRISWRGQCPASGHNVRLTANVQKSGIL